MTAFDAAALITEDAVELALSFFYINSPARDCCSDLGLRARMRLALTHVAPSIIYAYLKQKTL